MEWAGPKAVLNTCEVNRPAESPVYGSGDRSTKSRRMGAR